MEQDLIRARNLGVQRSGRRILREIDFTLRRGEIVTVIGPNGAGKTTLARTLLGLQPYTDGDLWRRHCVLGYVPQYNTVRTTMPMTVYRFLSWRGRLARASCEEALAELEIKNLADMSIHHLSGGQVRRVLLVRAMLRRPDLLVLDEPLQGIDVRGESLVYQAIDRIRRRTNCGIVTISHDLHVVMRKTDRVVCLNGHICCEGQAQTVMRSPAYTNLFVKESEELMVYQHHHDHEHTADKIT